MSKIRHSPGIIWDLDGTLVRLDVSAEQVASIKRMLSERFGSLGFRQPFSPLLPTLESALNQVVERMSAADAEAFRLETYSLLDSWEADAIEEVHVLPRTARLLSHWSGNGATMALVTNNGPNAVRRALSALAKFARSHDIPDPDFVSVSVRSPSVRAKPDPDGFRGAFRDLCTTSKEPLTDLVTIGDGSADWEAAAALADDLEIPVWTVVAREDRLVWSGHAYESGSQGDEPEDLFASLGLPIP